MEDSSSELNRYTDQGSDNLQSQEGSFDDNSLDVLEPDVRLHPRAVCFPPFLPFLVIWIVLLSTSSVQCLRYLWI